MKIFVTLICGALFSQSSLADTAVEKMTGSVYFSRSTSGSCRPGRGCEGKLSEYSLGIEGQSQDPGSKVTFAAKATVIAFDFARSCSGARLYVTIPGYSSQVAGKCSDGRKFTGQLVKQPQFAQSTCLEGVGFNMSVGESVVVIGYCQ